ncbi:MAG: hypothetical protein WCS73_10675 [Lentisphaeria bacterium]
MMKKTISISFLLIFTLCGCVTKDSEMNADAYVYKKGVVPACQMLLSRKQQKALRREVLQQKKCPDSVRERVSEEAAREGFELLQDHNLVAAMLEFNHAWRYNPKQYAAWWGASAIRSMQAEAEKDPAQSIRYLEDSITLLEKAVELAPGLKKFNVQSDLANCYSLCGKANLAIGKKHKGMSFLTKGKKIITELIKQFPNGGRFHSMYAVNAFYRGDFATAKYEIAEAERCMVPVDPELKDAVLKKMAESNDKATK